jgi:cytoskeletal protein CcmA (bactofilin family)
MLNGRTLIGREEPQRSQNTQSSPARPAEERRVTVWVGKSVIFKGELTSSENMNIDGRIEGTIDVRDHNLTIGPDAVIHADITAKTITIYGAVTGSLKASDKVDIRNSGSVDGDITAPRVSIAEGADLRGHIDTLTGHDTRRPLPWARGVSTAPGATTRQSPS